MTLFSVLKRRELLFGDSMKIFCEIKSVDYCRLLQEDFNRIGVRSQTGLKCNANKCVVVRYCRKPAISQTFLLK